MTKNIEIMWVASSGLRFYAQKTFEIILRVKILLYICIRN